MHLVDDDVRELRERRVARELAQQQPRRHEHELRAGARAARVLAADRVADRLAERLAALARDALGDRHGRDAARLRDDDLARRPIGPLPSPPPAAPAPAVPPDAKPAAVVVVVDDAGGRVHRVLAVVEQELRHLRVLAAARLARDEHDRVRAHGARRLRRCATPAASGARARARRLGVRRLENAFCRAPRRRASASAAGGVLR